MTDQPHPAIGTIGEEAARLIEAMALMARSSAASSQNPSPYAGGPAQEPAPPEAPQAARPPEHPSTGAPSTGAPSTGVPSAGRCSECGGRRDGAPAACRLCPLCQGIALLRSIRPETVDRLADLASALAASLRDVATQSRASGRPSAGGPASARPSDGRATVQDIPVDDGYEG